MRAALLAVAVLAAVSSAAARADDPPPAAREAMTLAQLQGVGCILVGTATAAGAVLYSALLAGSSAAANWSIPFLFVPAAAGAYAVGCSVGAVAGPGAQWLYEHYGAHVSASTVTSPPPPPSAQ